MTATQGDMILQALASLSAILSLLITIAILCTFVPRAVDYVKNNFNEKQKRILHIVLYIISVIAYIAMTVFAIWYFTTH